MTASSLLEQEGEKEDSIPVKCKIDLNASKECIQPVQNKSSPCSLADDIQNDSSQSSPSDSKTKSKKHVAISEVEDENMLETSVLRRSSETSDSAEQSVLSDNFITMTGTITRGKKKGQNIDVVLNISREELEVMETAIRSKANSAKGFTCKKDTGPHITLWSLICMPYVLIFSAFYSFYMGTLTWYNIFTLFSEEKPILYRILVSPLLILVYPFAIITLSTGFGVYSSFIQLSWYWDSWLKEITDLEKGFYGWLCNLIGLSDCCPYEVVILTADESLDKNSSPKVV